MQSRYEFVLHGRLDRDVVPALRNFTRTTDGDFVVMRGDLDSDHGLADVLSQFAELGLGLHSFRQIHVDEAAARSPNSGDGGVSEAT